MPATAETAMQTTLGTPQLSSIAFFFLIVGVTLVITYWAPRRTRTSCGRSSP